MASEPNEIHAVFCGGLDQAAVQRMFNFFTTATSQRITHAHLLFQSVGGFVGDGVCLYNFFRTLPLELTLYNVGGVYSAGVIAFLGASHRKTSPYAAFMIHRSNGGQPSTAAGLAATAKNLVIDDERTEAIIRSHVTLTDDQWKHITHHDLYIDGKQAVSIGIADEIGEFKPAHGKPLINV